LSCRLDKKRFMITGQHAPLGFSLAQGWWRSTNGKPMKGAARIE